MDDCIIEGDETIISDEEIVINWDIKATRKIVHKLCVCDDDKILDEVLKDYVWVLRHHALKFKKKKLLKEKMIRHVRVFHFCCVTIGQLPTELPSYWKNMETLLVILCHLELDVIRCLKIDNIEDYKDRIVEEATRLIYFLSVFLLNHNARIFHVLLKLRVRYDSRAWKDVLKILYRHFLVMVHIKDRSEENFCRNYLLFETYKKLVNKENHEKMDRVLFERFRMSPDDINKSRTLKKILSPSISSVIDLVDVLTDRRQTSLDNYFKHIDKKNRDDDYIQFSINLESDSEDAEELTTGMNKDNSISEIKIEDDTEDEIRHYSPGYVICVDDDSDIEEISLPRVSKTITPSLERTEPGLSFLEAIKIPDDSEVLPVSTMNETTPSTIEERSSSPEIRVSSSPLPFIDLYLDNLKTTGRVLEIDMSETNRSTDLHIEEETRQLDTTEDNQVENIAAEEDLDTSTLPPTSPVQKPTESVNTSEVAPSENIELETTNLTEKTVDISTSTDDFNFISGLITPPISDRINDDLNHAHTGSTNVYVPNMITMDDIAFHQYETDMEVAINSSVAVTNSPVSNESGDAYDNVTDMEVAINSSAAVTNSPVSNEVGNESGDAYDKVTDMEVAINSSAAVTNSPVSNEVGNESGDAYDNVTDVEVAINSSAAVTNSPVSNENGDAYDNVTDMEVATNSSAAVTNSPVSNEVGNESGGAYDNVTDVEVAINSSAAVTNSPVSNEVGNESRDAYDNVTDMEVAINSSAAVTNSPVSNEVGNESGDAYDNVTDVEVAINSSAAVTNSPVSNDHADDNVGSEVVHNAESQENVEEHLDLNDSLHIDEDSHTLSCSATEMEPSDLMIHIEDIHTAIDIEECHSQSFPECEDDLLSSVDLTPEDMVLEDYQLPTSDITETVTRSLPGLTISTTSISEEEIINLPSSIAVTTSENEYDLHTCNNHTEENVSLENIQSQTAEIRDIVFNNQSVLPILKNTPDTAVNTSENICKTVESATVNFNPEVMESSRDAYKNVGKIQASVSIGDIINGINTRIQPKLNGDTISKPTKAYGCEKVIYTSSERVSASLSVFSKFEQAQAGLAENTFSGPIEPIYSYPNMDSEHSNSNDSMHSFPYVRPQPKFKKTSDSPISPPYEQIQAHEYENHIMSVDYNNLISTINTPLSHMPKPVHPKPCIQNNKQNAQSEIIGSRKRKLDLSVHRQKKTKVNFGPTEVRIIPRDDSKLIEDQVLEEASESMMEYKIGVNDVKLVYLQPQIPIKIESISELQEKEQQLKIRGLLHNANDRLNPSDNSCILKRVDYNKIKQSVGSTERDFGHKISNLIAKPSGSIRIDSVPSGYIPPINDYSSVHGLQSSIALGQQQNFNNQSNNTFNDNFNSEILNLSVSSKVVSELDSPESEFSSSPKLLQNFDQVVQNCLADNLDNNESVSNVHDPILLSNNSNFYAKTHQTVVPPRTEEIHCQQPVTNTDNLDNYQNELDDLMLQNELDKLLEEKLINTESECCLPLKKRRLLPKLNETAPPFIEEISYPATPMISIAEIEGLHQNTAKNARSFKTPAERKEMPPIPFIYNNSCSQPTPIIVDQFNVNNHTYNNPTINYHMNTVPLPFINVPCASYYPFQPFLVPFNNVTTYDTSLNQEIATVFKKEEEPSIAVKTVKKQKKEKKKRSSKTAREFFEKYVPDKNFIF